MTRARYRRPRKIAALALLLGGALGFAEAGLAQAPGDIVWQREGVTGEAAGFDPAIFPHWRHRIRYRCSVCHPALFEMKAGANKITMKAIGEGKFCGTCHTGRIAFDVGIETCNRCHRTPTE